MSLLTSKICGYSPSLYHCLKNAMHGMSSCIFAAVLVFLTFAIHFAWLFSVAPYPGNSAAKIHAHWPFKSQKRDSSRILHGYSLSHY